MLEQYSVSKMRTFFELGDKQEQAPKMTSIQPAFMCQGQEEHDEGTSSSY